MSASLIIIILVVVTAALFYFKKVKNSMISPQKFKELLDEESGSIIDVRTPEEYADGHLKKVSHNFNVMSDEFNSKLDSLDKDETYYLYCRSGNRSGKGKKLMEQNGFTNVFNVGGYQDLVDTGFESEK